MSGRRGNNEGSIYRRKADGRWCGRVVQPDGTRKHFYGRTRAEVAERLNGALTTTRQGIAIPGDRLTVGE